MGIKFKTMWQTLSIIFFILFVTCVIIGSQQDRKAKHEERTKWREAASREFDLYLKQVDIIREATKNGDFDKYDSLAKERDKHFELYEHFMSKW